jgi:hypothetical protein
MPSRPWQFAVATSAPNSNFSSINARAVAGGAATGVRRISASGLLLGLVLNRQRRHPGAGGVAFATVPMCHGRQSRSLKRRHHFGAVYSNRQGNFRITINSCEKIDGIAIARDLGPRHRLFE